MQTTKPIYTPKKDKSPLFWGLTFGIVFGFLLQKGGATKYDVIIGQLLLSDFTVLKIMLSAALTGMIGIYFMKNLGWIELYPKSGSIGKNIIGGLIFGIGFALLGYCPGTIAGAVGNDYVYFVALKYRNIVLRLGPDLFELTIAARRHAAALHIGRGDHLAAVASQHPDAGLALL